MPGPATTAFSLPCWAQVIQALGPALATLVVGSLGIFIAYRQWKTARDKLKLDLFDRRYALYEELRGHVSDFLVGRDQNLAFAVAGMIPRFRMLFGKVGEEFVKSIHQLIVDSDRPSSGGDYETSLAASARLRNFHQEADEAIGSFLNLSKLD